MPNLSPRPSAQPLAPAPRTWTQSRSHPGNGKKPSRCTSPPAAVYLPGVLPTRHRPRRGDEALPTSSGDDVGHGECSGGWGELWKDHGRFELSQHSAAARGKPTSVCGEPGQHRCLRGRAGRKQAVGLQPHATPRRRGAFAKIAFFSAFLPSIFFFFFPQKKAIQALELIKQRTERLGCAGCSYESNSALRGKQFGFSKAAPCAVPCSASVVGQTQGLGGLFCTPQGTPHAPPCLGLMGGAGLSSAPALPRGFAMQQMPGLCQLLAKRTWLCHAATSCLLPAVYKL